MSILSRFKPMKREQGLTMVELILFIVIISIAVVGILQVMSNTTQRSADPQLRKQALAVAEALLEEVQLTPFTTCDPDGFDPVAGTCTQVEVMGPEPGEARGNALTPFDNVNDYNGLTLAGGSTGITNSATVVVPQGYNASIRVVQEAGFGPAGSVPADAVLRITVTVAYSGGNVAVEGYRTRYAPNATP